MGTYVSQDEVEDFLSRSVVRDVLDDNNDGFADALPIARLIADGEALFNGKITGVYAMPLTAPYDPLCVTVSLMFIRALAAQRHPEVMRQDGSALMADAMSWADMIRSGKLQMQHPLSNSAGIPDVLSDDAMGCDLLP